MSTTVKVVGAAGAVILGFGVYGIEGHHAAPSHANGPISIVETPSGGQDEAGAGASSNQASQHKNPPKKETSGSEIPQQVPAEYVEPNHRHNSHSKPIKHHHKHVKPRKSDTKAPSKGPGKHKKPKVSIKVKVKIVIKGKSGVSIEAKAQEPSLAARLVGGINPLQ
ncbi:hypothetical protein [Streptomyces sp. NPDC048489]|uniref:hypothetical protein n=1 Tax=Streptomyces sp. NPDC048489 TaxID=3154504 RepID=UPI003426B01B